MFFQGVKDIKYFYIVVYLFVSVIFSTDIEASFGFDVFIDHSNVVQDAKQSIDLEYGSYKTLNVGVKSQNQWCDIECNINIDRSSFADFPKIVHNGPESFKSYTINAPLKGREGGQDLITINIRCNQIDSLTCDPLPVVDSKDVIINVNYHLTRVQKEARDYVSSNLPQLTNDLTSADTEIKGLEDKLSQLTPNVKAGSVRGGVNTLRGKYSSYKIEANTAKSLFEDLDYVSSKNAFRNDLASDVNKLITGSTSLEEALNSIIKRHNEFATKLSSLIRLNENIKERLRILNEDNAITSEIEGVAFSFNSGNFDSYDSIELDIKNLELRGQVIEKDLAEKIESLKKDAVFVFTTESSRICKNENVCIPLGSVGSIESACSGLKELSMKVAAENSKRKIDFDDLKNQIRDFDDNITEINNKINELNTKLKGKDLDIKPCSSLIEQINAQIQNKKIPNLNDIKNICLNMDSQLEGGNVKSKGILGRIFSKILHLFGVENDQIKNIEKLNEPGEPSFISLSKDADQFISSKCEFTSEEIKGHYNISTIRVIDKEIKGESIGETKEKQEQCCVAQECTPCCLGDSCKKDPSTYPIIFVHGHSAESWNSLDYSVNSFGNMQDKLNREGKYISAGILLPDTETTSVNPGDWGKVKRPVSVRISYYNGVYDKEGRTVGKRQDQSIDIYSQRLSKLVDNVLLYTNKDKVIIIAHSMGGLVSRNYIKKYGGGEKVYKLVTIGTPNHGVYTDDLAGGAPTGLCGLTHLNLNLPECKDMVFDSSFIQDLNAGSEVNPKVKTLAIVGVCEGCESFTNGYPSDEVVRVASAELNGAKIVLINGSKIKWLDTFHQNLVRNEKVYSEIKKFLDSK